MREVLFFPTSSSFENFFSTLGKFPVDRGRSSSSIVDSGSSSSKGSNDKVT